MKVYKCAGRSLSLETFISCLQFHTKPKLEYSVSFKKIRFLSLKPIFLILLMIRIRPFEAQILSFNAMATEGRGVTQQTFIRGGSARKSNPLPFYIPFFTKKVPLFHIPSCRQMVSLLTVVNALSFK